MKERADIAAIIAGGLDTRLVSTSAVAEDKGAVDLGGAPVYSFLVDRLAPQADTLVVVAPEKPEWFDALPEGTRHSPDVLAADGRATGPAGALAAALNAAREISEDALLLTAPVDSPFLPTDLFLRLCEALNASAAEAALVSSRGKLLPTFGLWRANLAERVVELIDDRRNRALNTLVQNFDALEVMAWDGVTIPPPFFSINTEEELAIGRDLAKLVAFRT